jgi:lipopolysaccharide/colanic/teichoic acid biosynthesis glycosyltransferase
MIQMAPGYSRGETLESVKAADNACRLPRVWGLASRDFHDAFWRSKGVQCITRGQRQHLQRGADLYLLIEPDQLVCFDIAVLADRLTWRSATVTRLRLLNEGQQRYSEHVVSDEDGYVQRIERRYRARVHGCSKIMLTFSKRIASIWMNAGTRPEGWERVRRSVSWAGVDHWRCPGRTFSTGDPNQERQYIEHLVERWPRPDLAIAGIEEVESGVWHVAGNRPRDDRAYIGPLWLGFGDEPGAAPILVGPACIEDEIDLQSTGLGVVVRNIAEIEASENSRSTGESRTGSLYPYLKRALDVCASASALLVLTPIMALIALCVLLESGRPVFFGHLRQGKSGRLFRCWKFRTMRHDAEQMARNLSTLNACDGPQVLIPNDPRVTRLGRILRAANLDELPQFWNVLVGDMSLVGPRPSPDDENQYCPAWRDVRLSVRPGITGLWQLNRTREQGQDFQEWIKFDIQYVQNSGLWFDATILARTAWMLLLRRRKHRARA